MSGNQREEKSGKDLRRPARHWLLLVFRMVLGGLFVVSASMKIMAPRALADAISGFQMVPESIALEAACLRGVFDDESINRLLKKETP